MTVRVPFAMDYDKISPKDLLVIWDFDDTIVETNKEFEKTNRDVAEIVSVELYGDVSEINSIVAYQRELDIEMVKKHGFIPPRYLMSWISTYENLAKKAGKTPRPSTLELIKETVEDLYIRQYQNFPNSVPVMKTLKEKGFSMIILTAGQDEIQKRKVTESGAIHFVDEVIVYPKKTPETLKEVMNRIPAQQYVMIGNSLKSDIHPALDNDIWGFHFERDTWEADHHDVDREHELYVHISSHLEIPEKLEEILNQYRAVAV